MKKKPVKELTRQAACKLQGQVDALEFLLSVKSEAIIREQARLAEFAVIALDHGVKLGHVFCDNDVVEHIMRCIQVHNIAGFKHHFPDGFAPNSVISRTGQDEQSDTAQYATGDK